MTDRQFITLVCSAWMAAGLVVASTMFYEYCKKKDREIDSLRERVESLLDLQEMAVPDEI